MKISEKGLQMIKNFEGLLLVASNKLDGVWTVGYGCTVGVKPYQRITEKEAEEMLLREIAKHESYVNKYANQLKLNQNQFDALVSFSYNCGIGNLKKLVAVLAVKIHKNKINNHKSKVVMEQVKIHRKKKNNKMLDMTPILSGIKQ